MVLRSVQPGYRFTRSQLKNFTMKSITNLPDGISLLPITTWENGHENFVHTFKKNASFKLSIPSAQSTNPYLDTTKNFQWLIQYALDNNLQLRALGNGWSFSEVAVCEGGLVDTKALRLTFNLKNSFLAPEYLQNGNSATSLFFAECGISVLDLDEKLEQDSNPKRSLRASGASNGQTIAGCTSTGTHGSAFNVGAVHDSIVGLHIITGPNSHVWLEKKSNPIASDDFITWLGAEAIRDDDMFNAAVVSFGSFGFIHGIVIETEPIFLLEQYRTGNIIYNEALKPAMNHLDFSTILNELTAPQSGPDKELYHFEILVNLQLFAPGDAKKGVYFKTMYKVPYRNDYTKITVDDKGFTYGDDLLGVMSTVLDGLGPGLSSLLVPGLVNKLFPLAFTANQSMTGTLGETFSNTKFRGKAASAAIGVSSENASTVLEEIVAINKEFPFAGALALRYVKGTEALLGFTHFPKTCIMELDGVDSKLSRIFIQKVWTRLEELAIPFTMHWGKFNFGLTPDLVQKMYGDNLLKWKSCRASLLVEEVRKVFTNNFMNQCGLTDA
jgi:FAD/FMN-containing dehydrogenase